MDKLPVVLIFLNASSASWLLSRWYPEHGRSAVSIYVGGWRIPFEKSFSRGSPALPWWFVSVAIVTVKETDGTRYRYLERRGGGWLLNRGYRVQRCGQLKEKKDGQGEYVLYSTSVHGSSARDP